MFIEKIVHKFFNKPEFRLSSDIPTNYIIYTGLGYTLGLVRGIIKKTGFNTCGSNLIVGKHTHFRVRNKIHVGSNVRIGKNVLVDALSTDGLFLGDNVKIGDNSKLMISGTLSDLGKGLRIGSNTSFSENTFFGSAGGIIIGSDVIAGQNVRFHAENHKFDNSGVLIRLQGVSHKGIKLGSNIWIGSGVTILDGSNIGDNCVIASGAVIQKEFPDNSIIGGVPAKVIRRLDEE
ncbi:MAG: acyltransferase [Streptococcaceae bacterium]|jgi:acetyltransferase-like isoleucine patch superfamily enzyme|nr:acyltransferase [Streptococcaceae bacterium]